MTHVHGFADGDCVVLRHKGDVIGMTRPLSAQARTSTRLGNIDHKNIIGKKIRDVVVSSKGKELRVHAPTIDEYIVMGPRLVTPIYPADANLITSLLDLHPDSGSFDSTSGAIPPIEILEAGTGHGSLTLHLTRAIHAANVGIPSAINHTKVPTGLWQYARSLAAGSFSRLFVMRTPALNADQSFEATPRAIIHSVDVSSKHSQHAAKVVGGFRRGMYMRNVNFVVGNVSEWIKQQMHARGPKPFLSHVLLDLPSSHTHVETAESALRVDGKLLVFNPSITQINTMIQCIRTKRLPLQLERVIEVGPAMTGGRIWDVRCVIPRAMAREVDRDTTFARQTDTDQAIKDGKQASHPEAGEEEPQNQRGLEIVCRPKVGERLRGGGFIALWSKNRTCKDSRVY
ncbi:MAG: hypothetical protein Q9204_000306 [Flavoplaca sp. TL-2023a]